MTTAQALAYFDVLIDKYSSPYFTDSEKLNFLNHAQYEYLNRMLPDSQGGVVNFEFDQLTAANIAPLLFSFSTTMDGSGIVTTSTMNTALQAATGDASSTLFRVASASFTKDGETYPIRFVKQNNIHSLVTNFFKSPTSPHKMRFTWLGNGLKFYPTDTESNGIELTVVKNPRTLALTPVNPEFGDYQMYNIITIAVQLADVSVRGDELLATLQGANVAK